MKRRDSAWCALGWIVAMAGCGGDGQPAMNQDPCDTQVAGTICRASTGPCDAPERCDRSSPVCPPDDMEPAGTPCAGSTQTIGACVLSYSCDGVSPQCGTTPLFKPAGTVCRAAVGACDVEDTCSGTSADCPADAVVAAGTVCAMTAMPCDAPERCDGTSKACPMDRLSPAGTVCRAAAGPCDVAEVCSGTAATCPADALAPASMVCRAATNSCDVAESCSGTAATCPADAFAAATVSCTDPAGGHCAGTSAMCVAPPTCTTPNTMCGTACVNLSADPTHCGTCTTACASGGACVNAICVTSGALGISMTWSRAGDADLVVQTASGNRITYLTRMGGGGTLDRDDTTGTGPENVSWSGTTAPASGTYYVCGETFAFTPAPSAASPVTLTAEVRIPGRANQTFTHTWTSMSGVGQACGASSPTLLGSFTLP